VPNSVFAGCVEEGFRHLDPRSGVGRILDVEGDNDAVPLLFLEKSLEAVDISLGASAVKALLYAWEEFGKVINLVNSFADCHRANFLDHF
jgi:hypothetical protein